ncbi:MAG: protease modulator HflC [Proteobacteria bacterium]|nr:protease modulator HflC [Pseudomonadota bacterium]MBU4275726.1 protease modulator HflC [Pseudomonadota bacterium]MBU4383761.1 protease modulator HflC [Pseudomonadota bacterium]MBU4605157.1 protease modulator HflC [Pseudomonadota bacterium]MCG2763403.1 protease modulator HflC [Desulfarculaceae bacterium]
MSTGKKTLPILVLVLLAALVASGAFFTVSEGQQAIVTQFGKPVGGPYKQAGLYFKIPMIQEVHTFEERLLKWDGSPNQIPTRDKKYIWVDTTARWRITNPLRFLQTVASERGALSRLDDIIDSVVRDQVSSNLLVELVRSSDWKPVTILQRDEKYMPTSTSAVAGSEDDQARIDTVVKMGRQTITRAMLAEAAKLTPQYGIQVVDIEIKRINYVESVQRQVFERMISERKRIASQYRSEGEGDKRRILGQMQKEMARIRSGAYKKAEKIKGQGDAEATRIYGKAYGRDPDFYALFMTLEAYGKADSSRSELILSTDSDFYKYLKAPK